MTEDLRSQTGDCEADARDCQELEAATTLRDVGTVGGGGVTKAEKLRPSTGSWSFSGGYLAGVGVWGGSVGSSTTTATARMKGGGNTLPPPTLQSSTCAFHWQNKPES